MHQAFLDYYRCPASCVDFQPLDSSFLDSSILDPSTLDEASAAAALAQRRPGYFNFGPDLIGYGTIAAGARDQPTDVLPDVLCQVRVEGTSCFLPFDPTEVATNLRYERYVTRTPAPLWKRVVRGAYYLVRPALPVSVRRHLQRRWLSGWDTKPFPRWPVDATVDGIFEELMRLALTASPQARIPFIWFWPEGKSSCSIMTHDVETAAGLSDAGALMDVNDSFRIKSSFQLIPDARYVVTPDIVAAIRGRGFEVNVHDLKHDGHLFDDHGHFVRSAVAINDFAVRFGSKGFRAGALYRNVEWYGAFRLSYDMSVPNVGHLDPQPGGCCTVMPYFVGDLLEIPVTMTQDYSLFNVLETYSQELWHTQIERVMQRHGLISFIVHPDYLDTVPARHAYSALLGHLSALRAEKGLWIALPGEVDGWWRQRSAMQLLPDGDDWRIEGSGAERARVAYATLENGDVRYLFA